MFNPIKAIRLYFQSKKMMDVQQFAHHHKNYLVIVVDPKDDTMFMSYQDKQVRNRIKTIDGKNRQIVKQMLRHSTFKSSIDMFLMALMESMQTPVKYFSNFGNWVDGALFAVSNAVSKRREDKQAFINNLMNIIVQRKDRAMFEKHFNKFSDTERKYLETKLSEVPSLQDETFTK